MDSLHGRRLYRFDMSLMERLSSSGLAMTRLDYQRRMRPEISSLVRYGVSNHSYLSQLQTDRKSFEGTLFIPDYSTMIVLKSTHMFGACKRTSSSFRMGTGSKGEAKTLFRNIMFMKYGHLVTLFRPAFWCFQFQGGDDKGSCVIPPSVCNNLPSG